MSTPYTVETVNTEYHAHMIVFGSSQNRLMFVGNVFPLTAKRKREIVRRTCELRNIPIPSDIPLETVFDRNPFCRWEDVTLRWQTVTNNATGDVRLDISDTHSHGGGSNIAANVTVVTL